MLAEVKVQIHERFESGLPADDDHPYRTGPWRPQTTEYDAWDLEVIEGEIPRDLAGIYLRNTENPLLPPIERYHPFDGDGMLHSISFEDGEAMYRNRFVRTDGFLAEREAGRALYAGAAENPANAERTCTLGARPNMKDASSTDIVVHGGVALSSFWLCGDLYRHDPKTLEPLGKTDFGGRFPKQGVSAHPKIDEHTGEMLFFNYGTEAPYMHYGVVDPDGTLAHYTEIELPGPRLPHDMAFTEHYTILNDCPMYWNPELLARGHHVTTFYPDQPTRFGVLPRRGSVADVRWFEAAPTYVLHWINAYEDGDEVVLDGFFQQNPSPSRHGEAASSAVAGTGFDNPMFRYLDLYQLKTVAHRWRFNMTTGKCKEEQLSDRIMEFGMINGRHGGRRHRYSYNALPAEGWFGFNGVIKHDIDAGTEEVVQLPEGVHASEAVIAPRAGAIGTTDEDDGYLLTFTMDMNRGRSECLILDAARPNDPPVARIALPERISCGTHAYWQGAA